MELHLHNFEASTGLILKVAKLYSPGEAGSFISNHCPLRSASLWHQLRTSQVWKWLRVAANPNLHFTLRAPRGCDAPVVTCSFPHTAASQRGSYFCPLHNTGFITLSPCAHSSPFLATEEFFRHFCKHLLHHGLCKHHPPKDPSSAFEFYLFQKTKRKFCRKVGSTPAALTLHQCFYSSVFCCTICIDGQSTATQGNQAQVIWLLASGSCYGSSTRFKSSLIDVIFFAGRHLYTNTSP